MRIASHQDKAHVVQILYSAFVGIDTPNSINFVVKQDSNRKKRLKYLMEYMFNRTIICGEIFISDNGQGCLLVLDSTKKVPKMKKIVWDLALIFKTIGFSNVFKVLKRENKLRKYHAREPHLHPWILGVCKEYQGKGIGIRLAKEVIDHHKGSTLPIIIETTTKENIRLYEFFGFKPFKEINNLGYPLTFLKN